MSRGSKKRRENRGQRSGGGNVHEPVSECRGEAKGSAVVNVVTTKESYGSETGIVQVDVSLSGPTPVDDTETRGGGRAQFTGLDPGDYTASITFNARIGKFYDLRTPPASQVKSIDVADTEIYLFKVPFKNTIKFIITYDDKGETGGTRAEGMGYALNLRKPEADDWEKLSEGDLTNGEVFEEYIPHGSYKLSLKLIREPSWCGETVKIGEPCELSALVYGFESGTDGRFEIVDARDPSTVLHSLNGRIDDDGATLKAEWTPEAGQLDKLEHAYVMFRVSVGTATLLSKPMEVKQKAGIEVSDDKGTALDTTVVLRFSDGSRSDVTSSGGKAEAPVPWGVSLSGIDLPRQSGGRASVSGDDIEEKTFVMGA